MSTVEITNTGLGNALTALLTDQDIRPGDQASYELCKQIYLFHPLGAKMVDGPINIAQSQEREIKVPAGPEDRLVKAFNEEWEKLNATNNIFNTAVLSRVYGIASVVIGAVGVPNDRPIAPKDLPGLDIFFNVLDPLNTAGSLVLDQNPNSPAYQKPMRLTVAGQPWHPSRACVIMNGEPIYIAYTTSAFGFVGRSVYQRALYPLKTFIESMRTDDLVIRKAGVLVAMLRAAGSAVDRVMQKFAGMKRNLLKEAQTNNVLSIEVDEKVESLNMQNTDVAMKQARTNVLENIAVAADMPAKMLNSETFAEGFGEGTEDAKMLARYINGVRAELKPLYDFFTEIALFRAWSPAFYETIKAEFPEYKDVGYLTAFYRWKNSFTAEWPSLLIEPESEQVKVEETKFKAINDFLTNVLDKLDPDNKAIVMAWAADNFNEQKLMFASPLVLDVQAMKDWYSEQDQLARDTANAAFEEANTDTENNTATDAEKAGKSSPVRKVA